MNRRTFTQALGVAALASLSMAAVAQTAKRHKIVIQVSDPDPAKWNLALNNARNLQEDVGAANVDIELVAYGPGIGMLKLDAPTNSRIADATKSGVKVLACENTMRNMKLVRDDMHPNISYVPAGVTQIMTRQSEGWSYLRP
jgi:uncharacterized protein